MDQVDELRLEASASDAVAALNMMAAELSDIVATVTVRVRYRTRLWNFSRPVVRSTMRSCSWVTGSVRERRSSRSCFCELSLMSYERGGPVTIDGARSMVPVTVSPGNSRRSRRHPDGVCSRRWRGASELSR